MPPVATAPKPTLKVQSIHDNPPDPTSTEVEALAICLKSDPDAAREILGELDKKKASLDQLVDGLRTLEHPLRSPLPPGDIGRVLMKCLPVLLQLRHYRRLAAMLPEATPSPFLPTLALDALAACCRWGGRFLAEPVITRAFQELKEQRRAQVAAELAETLAQLDKYKQPTMRNVGVGEPFASDLSSWAKFTDRRLHYVKGLLKERDDLVARLAAFDAPDFDALVAELVREFPRHVHTIEAVPR